MAKQLAGEIDALRCAIAYNAGDVEGTIFYARQALDLLDSELWIVRVMVRMYLGGGLLLKGDEKGGYQAYYGAFEEEKVQNKRFKATLLMTACYFHWISADLQSMAQAARQSIAICPQTDYRSIQGYGKYNLGRVHYQQNDLAAAEELTVADQAILFGQGLLDVHDHIALGKDRIGRCRGWQPPEGRQSPLHLAAQGTRR